MSRETYWAGVDAEGAAVDVCAVQALAVHQEQAGRQSCPPAGPRPAPAASTGPHTPCAQEELVSARVHARGIAGARLQSAAPPCVGSVNFIGCE